MLKRNKMKKKILNFIAIVFVSTSLLAQVGIGTTTPDASAILQIDNTSRGILMPRMTQVQKSTIATPVLGLLVFQTDGTAGFYYYNGSAWVTFGGGSGWDLSGNSGTASTTNMLGTTDAQDLSLVANNTEVIRVTSDKKTGINTATPSATFDVVGPNIAAQTPAIRIQDGTEAAGYVLTSDVNGNGTWVDPNSFGGGGADVDWALAGGAGNPTVTDPIYRLARTNVGASSTSISATLDINNAGSNDGASMGVGSDEYIRSINSTDAEFSHAIVPVTDGNLDLGASWNSWTNIYATNTTIQTSDIRKKIDIQPLSYGIESIMNIRPVSYKWKDEVYGKLNIKERDKRVKIGFITQEVNTVIPEVIVDQEWTAKSESEPDVVVKKETKIMGMRYIELLPVVVKATQEHEGIIEKINNQQQEILQLLEAVGQEYFFVIKSS